MSGTRDQRASRQPFPPDERLPLPTRLSFVRLLAIVVVLFAAVDYARVGATETPIPYDYPFYVGIGYLLGVMFMLPRIHRIMDEVKVELVDIAERTATDDPVSDRDTDVTPEQIHTEFERITAWAFRPRNLVGGALFGGAFALAVMATFDVLAAYPYLLMNFAYGAGHGLFYVPVAGTMWLVWRISRRWIVDIDPLDPDGMGGYRKIGDAVVSLVIYVIVFVTVDFFIISSVSFVDRAVFQNVALLLYAGMLVFFLLFTVGGVFLIRRRLLEIRERKTEMMRRQFREIEQRYWDKQQRGERAGAEAEHIRTMQILFSRLHQMDLWPVDLLSFLRLAASTAASLALVALQEGWIHLPV